MIDFKSVLADHDLDETSCRTSRVGTVMPGNDRQMYYCVVDEIEQGDVHYCEIDDYECRYVLPSAFDSIGQKPEREQETPSYSAGADPEGMYPLPASHDAVPRRPRNERPRQLTLDLPE